MVTKRGVAQLLKHLADAGVTHIPRVEQPAAGAGPTPRGQSSATRSKLRESSLEKPAARPARERLFNTSTNDEATRPELLAETQELMARTHSTLQQKTDALCALAKTVAACRRCMELAETRTQTVFGVGNADADIMFIGEAPGADEDASGEPFVGRAGQLLNKIIEACTLKREDLYICNILRCRPPGNRNPLPQEAANCREFLDAQIRIVSPKYIVCWGTIAAQNLLGEVRPVGKLRRQFFQHAGASVLCTYHPSYLLRNPSAKKDVWEDMKLFMGQLGVELK
jgi:DNA polymerase